MTRVALGGVGVAMAAYGLWLALHGGDLGGLVTWLVLGVVVHDLVLAPLVLVVCLIGGWLLPRTWRWAASAGFVVLGTLTALAVPVLGRFGARPDNSTLLDRDYVAGWLLLAALTLLGVVAGVLTRRATTERGTGGQGSRS